LRHATLATPTSFFLFGSIAIALEYDARTLTTYKRIRTSLIYGRF